MTPTAREIGASFSAHSDAPGRGAAFTLELPVGPPAEPGPAPADSAAPGGAP